MNAMLRYRYTIFDKIKLPPRHIAIGTIVLIYKADVIFTLLSIKSVVRAIICVEMLAKNICHVVRVIEYGNRVRIHLLRRIMTVLRKIQNLD